jgi:cytochrome c-type biogenesis protein CcmH
MSIKPLILIISLLMSALSFAPAFAVEPDEVLTDAGLESRARQISKELRCLVCRNENIDESNADLAKDLRLLVRERLLAGDTDAEVLAFVVARYGEYVLLSPTSTGANKALWSSGPVMFLFALWGGYIFVRKSRKNALPSELTADEKKRLDALLDE